MKICSSCGKQIPENAVTCAYCGNGFIEEKPSFQLDEARVERIQKTAGKIGRGINIISGLPFLLIGLLMFFGLGSDAIKYHLYKGEAKATYKESINCVLYDGDDYKTCDNVYSFSVDGKEYTYTDPMIFCDNIDKEIDIIYSKRKPSNNIEKKGSPDYIGAFMGFIIFLVGIAAVFGKGEVSVSTR